MRTIGRTVSKLRIKMQIFLMLQQVGTGFQRLIIRIKLDIMKFVTYVTYLPAAAAQYFCSANKISCKANSIGVRICVCL
jgi:hypothetical protein